MSKLTPDERETFRNSGIFAERPAKLCEDCGGYHLHEPCRRVKRQQWLGNGNRTEVEYWPDGSWNEEGIIYYEDVFDDEETNE